MSAQSLIWLIIALLGVADGIGLSAQGMSVDRDKEWAALLLILIPVALARLCLWRNNPHAARFATTLAQLIAFCHVGSLFTYALMAASPFQFADALFEHADLAIGFHWLAWFNWVNHHRIVHIILGLAFGSMVPQAFILTAFFAYMDAKRVDELLVAAMLAIIIICPIMYRLPSVGAYLPYGIVGGAWEADILALRSHTLLIINSVQGIVTFPSYHTVLGILLTNMALGRKWLFYPLLGLNCLLIASVPSQGGHYFVDMLTGVAVAFVALGATQFLLARCSQDPLLDGNRLGRAHVFGNTLLQK